MHAYVYSSIIYNGQEMEATQVFTHRRKDVIHTHTQEYFSTIKKKDILPWATLWMDFEGSVLSEISQKENTV